MRIKIEINVPDGEYCGVYKDGKHCNFLSTQFMDNFCIIYDCEVEQKKGVGDKKCPACLKACEEAKYE